MPVGYRHGAIDHHVHIRVASPFAQALYGSVHEYCVPFPMSQGDRFLAGDTDLDTMVDSPPRGGTPIAAVAEKSPVKKPPANSPVKKASPQKSPAKKSPAKKGSPQKSPAKKSPANSSPKKSPAKKPTPKKPTPQKHGKR